MRDAGTSVIDNRIWKASFLQAFIKMNPKYMIKNPVMFVVEISMVITAILTAAPSLIGGYSSPWFNATVTILLFMTVYFGNFAESMAEGQGKAQAESLQRSRKEIMAKVREQDGSIRMVSSLHLRVGDVVVIGPDDFVPGDGEIIEGIASINEAAITGESNPVIKEAGGDNNSVTGGTRVISNQITVKITANPGETFLDRMIGLVTSAERQQTPNEKALNTLLNGLTYLFILICTILIPVASYSGFNIPLATLAALLVCLIPTTIGGLLSAIGIAGIDRVTAFNVVAKSGKAVEAAGDVHTIIFDKTGTITYGNRMASTLIPVLGVSKEELNEAAAISSLHDHTPEGRSTLELAVSQGFSQLEWAAMDTTSIEFSARTRISGTDLPDGRSIRKGAVESLKRYVEERGGIIPVELDALAETISKEGGTPLAVVSGTRILGLIYLQDTIKPGMREKFEELRKLGIRTIMCTGDNPLTAATIARQAGVDEFVAEATPEDKIRLIHKEQAEGKLVAMTGDGTNDAPALAQADVGIAMNNGTSAAKEAANMVDLDSDPAKIIEVIAIGKQMLMTRGAVTTFGIANDVAKYFAIIPAMFAGIIPQLQALNIMHLSTSFSAIISALIFNAIVIPLLIPLAIKGIKFRPMDATALLGRNVLIYGAGGLIAPFIGIKLIDMLLTFLNIL